jgi:hypothetical protein
MTKLTFPGKRVLSKALIFGGALSLGTVAYLFFSRSNPVVLRLGEGGAPGGAPFFTIFNPFRDRAPERSAEQFLELMKGGQCEQLMDPLADTAEYKQHTCVRERGYPLSSWRLINRSDDAQEVRLHYTVWRENYDGLEAPVWITAERRDGRWQVTKYERWY